MLTIELNYQCSCYFQIYSVLKTKSRSALKFLLDFLSSMVVTKLFCNLKLTSFWITKKLLCSGQKPSHVFRPAVANADYLWWFLLICWLPEFQWRTEKLPWMNWLHRRRLSHASIRHLHLNNFKVQNLLISKLFIQIWLIS